MSEQVATAQPAPEVAGGQAAPEASATVTQDQINLAKTPDPSLDDQLSDIWDKNHSPPAKKEETPASDQPATAAPEPAQSSPAIEPPQSWSADVKAKWAALPPDVQTYVAQRESEVHRAITRAGNELKTYEPLRPILSAMNQRLGVPQGREAELIAQWAGLAHAMENNPAQTLQAIAQSYNVDLARLTGQQQPPTSPQTPTESVEDLFRDNAAHQRIDKQVVPVVQQLQGKVDQLSAYIAAQHAEAQKQYEGRLQQAIGEFSKDKAHWDDLYQDVVAETKFIKANNPDLSPKEILERAYQRAERNNDSVRQRVEAAREKERQDAALKEAAKKAAEAKKMSAMNVRTGASASTPTHDGAWNDMDKLSSLYDRITGGR